MLYFFVECVYNLNAALFNHIFGAFGRLVRLQTFSDRDARRCRNTSGTAITVVIRMVVLSGMSSPRQRLGTSQRTRALSNNSMVSDGKEPTNGIMLMSEKISTNDKAMTVVTKTVAGAKRRGFNTCVAEMMTSKEKILSNQFMISIAIECKCKPTISFTLGHAL